MIYDQKNKISSMKINSISQSAAKQRAGRAGRTNEGFCFRLYSEETKNSLRINKTPEIQNMALDTAVLRIKSLGLEDVLGFPYLSPPDPEGLKESLETMRMLGCLDEKTDKITEIGRMLVKIPIEPFLSRAIIEGIFFERVTKEKEFMKALKLKEEDKKEFEKRRITDSIIQILCMVINSGNLFIIRNNQKEEAEKNKFNEFAKS